MLWNEFIKLNHISKLSLNEQMRKFNEHIMYEEQVAGGIVSVPVTITNSSPNGVGLTTKLYINGALNQTQTNIGSKTAIVDVRSTFFIVIDNFNGYDGIEYRLRNNGIQIDYQNGVSQLTSTTFTTAPGGNYVFTCNGFST